VAPVDPSERSRKRASSLGDRARCQIDPVASDMATGIEPHAAGWCVHFTGTRNDSCKLGVRYDDVRDEPPNQPYRWPCLLERDCTTTCAQLRRPTAEEIAAYEGFMTKAIAKLEERERSGLCVACGVPVERGEQVGSCVYAHPCGHRQGQGDAAEFNRQLRAA